MRTLKRLAWAAFRAGLQHRRFRNAIAVTRAIYYIRIRRRYREYTDPSDLIAENTIAHNRRGVVNRVDSSHVPPAGSKTAPQGFLFGVQVRDDGGRSNRLLRPLRAIEAVERGRSKMDVLSIGPRTEAELLSIMSYGFTPRNIRALDLISYSPWIELGDMHHMPYSPNSFDVVISGWVLAYSEDKKAAADEMVRVARPGALIAVGVSTATPATIEKVRRRSGYIAGSVDRLQSTGDILALFGDHLEHVYFNHDRLPRDTSDESRLMIVFSVRK